MQPRGLQSLLLSGAAFQWLIIALAFLTAVAAFFSPPSTLYQPHQVTLQPKLGPSPATAKLGPPAPLATGAPGTRMESAQDLDPETAAFHGQRREQNPKPAGYAVGVTGIRG
jgi:hypothetical protein